MRARVERLIVLRTCPIKFSTSSSVIECSWLFYLGPSLLFSMSSATRLPVSVRRPRREQKLNVASDNKFALHSLEAQLDAAVVYLGLQMASVAPAADGSAWVADGADPASPLADTPPASLIDAAAAVTRPFNPVDSSCLTAGCIQIVVRHGLKAKALYPGDATTQSKIETYCSEVLEDSQLSRWNRGDNKKVLTGGKLGEVTAGSLAQAAHMELTLALALPISDATQRSTVVYSISLAAAVTHSPGAPGRHIPHLTLSQGG
ncbi:MAG: hypothetical protein FRX49_07937 [Trebouxia sp. A1-2]|nr:MAG: hypothetical protein FRX49_07937 [Trebouxia sp. A1-2]